jgi:hypothetical protein
MPDAGGAAAKYPVLTSQVASGNADDSDVSGVRCAITGIFFKGSTANDALLIKDVDGNTVFEHIIETPGQYFMDLPHPLFSKGIDVDITVTSSVVWSLSFRELE